MVDTALVAILGVALAALLAMVQFEIGRINTRLDRIEDEVRGLRGDLAEVREEMARIGQRLDDHITDHPGQGPTQRLMR